MPQSHLERSPERTTVKVTIQYSDSCPHWQLAEHRVRQALQDLGRHDVTIERQHVDSHAEAQTRVFHGSPTLLIDGRDFFGGERLPVVLTCRVYETEFGPDSAPSVAQLRHVLRRTS
jgi:hypothetical protein